MITIQLTLTPEDIKTIEMAIGELTYTGMDSGSGILEHILEQCKLKETT